MSLVLAVRMIEFISTFEDDVYNAVNSSLGGEDDWDDDDAPMPIGML
jgi:hypothetical protein